MKFHSSAKSIFTFVFVALSSQFVVAQAWKEDVGFNDLVAEKGAALEDGTGVTVVQVEAGVDYMSDPGHVQNSGKNFTNGSGSSSVVSGHARSVGFRLYGNTLSMTPGITDITGFQAEDYLDRVLGHAGGGDPLAQGFDIGNHSYIGNATVPDQIDYLTRFDFVADRDNTVMVVGTNNSGTTPRLLAPSINAISVGKSNGTHATGLTSDYGFARLKPDIVAPESFTSFSTPIVAGAAAILREAGAGTNMINNEVIKSTLFAGATKDEFAGWSRTTTQPIDDVYGHGELNILNSYHIWEGGEFEGSTTDPATDVGHDGWDYGDFDGTNDLFYDFEIADHLFAKEISASLVWNVKITDLDASAAVFDPESVLANLNLQLYDSSGSFLGALVDESISDYNTEHIYVQDLAAGNYTFRVSGDIPTDFGFSWRIEAVPEPSGGLAMLGFLAVAALRRRRKGTNCS